MVVELRCESLDGLVVEHLSYHSAQGSQGGGEEEVVRGLLLAGAFSAAADRLRRSCPALADNQWLEFQLKRHHFMRLASLARADSSPASKEARAQHLREAIELARRELAPLALHAYCEAYQDFKSCMLALLPAAADSSSSGGGDGSDPDGSAAQLREFAGVVARAARRQLGRAHSKLAQLLRYLALLHRHQHHGGFHPHWWPAVSAQTQQLCGALLRPQRDALPPAALEPLDGALLAGGQREQDVQALRTSLGCDREEAVALLRRSRGEALAALRDALQAQHIDEALLAELADEYAAWRGLEMPPPPQEPAAEGGAMAAEGMQVDAAAAQQEQQQPSGEQQQRPSKLARKAAGGPGAPVAEEQAPLQLGGELSEQQLRCVLRQLERLLAAGQAERAVEQLQAADPALLPDHPSVAFALHRCRFQQCLAATPADGTGVAAALVIVRQHLSPLAQQRPEELQAPLKAVLAQLLPVPTAAAARGGEGCAAQQVQQQQGVADALAAVRSALLPRCHIKEPRLLPLLRELLSLHTAHFKLQRCQDRFAGELGIVALKSVAPVAAAPAPAPGGGGSTAAAAAMAAEAQQALAAAAGAAPQWDAGVPVPVVRPISSDSEEQDYMGEDSEEEGDGSQGTGVSEAAILTVCEFTGLPRHTAIDLLLAHGGDAAAVLIHVFP